MPSHPRQKQHIYADTLALPDGTGTVVVLQGPAGPGAMGQGELAERRQADQSAHD